MNDTTPDPADEAETPDLLDPTDFGPEDVLGNGPVTDDTAPEPEPAGAPGDPDLHDDEAEPTA